MTDGAQAATFDWVRCWYPVAFVRDLPDAKPFGFSIHDEPLVLFRAGDGVLSCIADRCPHRAARLSDGRAVDGRLECLYHGWQFAPDGRCVHVPQIAPGTPIPERARVRRYAVVERQGIAWVWTGDSAKAPEDEIPVVAELDRPEFTSVDFMMDLPYGQPYLVENVIDIAHIHFAHDGIRGGGRRELAAPLEFDVVEESARAIRSRFRSVREEGANGHSSLRGASVAFVAPNLVRYESEYGDPALASGLALYSLPLSDSRCRLLYRAYSNFPRLLDRVTPRAVAHWTQCTILEQDMRLVMGQSDEIERSDVPLRDLWLPLRSSDALVVSYRRWLDAHAATRPTCRGFATVRRSEPRDDEVARPTDRLRLHTRICASCSRAHRLCARASSVLGVAVVVLLAGAVIAHGTTLGVAAAVSALVAGAGALLARAFASRFE